jgi:hypothetical protein
MAKKTSADPPAVAAAREPLFPQPLPVIGVTGEFGSGKSLFIATICPGPESRLYDFEKSLQSYQSLGFERIDAYSELLKRHPGGYKGPQLWEWWRSHVQAIKPGQFRVIGIDTVTPLEDALGDWVMDHAADFGRTRKQYVNNLGQPTGLFWGDMKSAWESALNDLAARCECFAFAAHMSTVYVGNAPTLKRKAKGKATLSQLASLYLQLERKADAKGNVPAEPSAIVIKQRAIHMMTHPQTKRLVIVPALPPRIPIATPDAIREYQVKPPDYRNLQIEERAPEEHLSDDERAELATRRAEAEAETERLRADREARQQQLADRIAAKKSAPAVEPATEPEAETQSEADAQAEAEPTAPQSGLGFPIAREQLERLAELRDELFRVEGVSAGERKRAWDAILAKRDVATARDLTGHQAGELIERLLDRIAKRKEEIAAESDADESPF